MAAWRLGLKAIAVYRDGSKRTQPLSTGKQSAPAEETAQAAAKPARRRLPDERRSITHKFSIGGHEGYITVGMYDDGSPGEVFVTMSKQGSVVSGLMDAFATAISMALQYGVPLEVLCSKFSHMRFEPSGFTNNREIPIAKSVLDYIFRWLSLKFLSEKPGAAREARAADDDGRRDPGPGAPPTSGSGGAPSGGRASGSAKRISRHHDIWLESEKGPQATAEPHAAQTEDTPAAARDDLSFEAVMRGLEARERETFIRQADAPPCSECGSIMVRNGACYKCPNCGSTFGCS
jgi:ribonucleoside-diphosphate reductase alpha chain